MHEHHGTLIPLIQLKQRDGVPLTVGVESTGRLFQNWLSCKSLYIKHTIRRTSIHRHAHLLYCNCDMYRARARARARSAPHFIIVQLRYVTVAEKDIRVLLLSCDFSRILRSRNEQFYIS